MSLKDQLQSSYLDWLKERITFKDLDGILQITTPLNDRHNDRLQIYVTPSEDHLKLSDDGYILNDLMMCGCEIFSSKKRMSLLETILNSHGVKLQGEELYVDATIKNYPQKKHSLLQAMLKVNDMFFTTRENVYSLFLEEVEIYLQKNDIRYTDNVSFTGKSGFNHSFDFVIPHFKDTPERVIKTINNPTRQQSEALLFSWNDTRENRKSNSVLYAFLNDTDKNISKGILSAFSEYQVKPVIWSNREYFVKELSA